MRIRATAAAAVVSGAVALTAVALPAAQAAGTASGHQAFHAAHQIRAAHPAPAAASLAEPAAKPADGGPYQLAVTFSNIKVGAGATAVPVGTYYTVHVPYTFSVTGDTDVVTADDFFAGVDMYRGSSDMPDNDLSSDNPPTCVAVAGAAAGTTVENCKGTVDIDPQEDLTNSDAGAAWHAVGWAIAFNGQDPTDPDVTKIGIAQLDGQKSPTLQRLSKLTVKAAGSVSKGKTVSVTGVLSRASWNDDVYYGFPIVPTSLQFRVAGGSYSTWKTVTTDSKGNLKYSPKPTRSGYWRYSFAGYSTTPAVSALGTWVSVK